MTVRATFKALWFTLNWPLITVISVALFTVKGGPHKCYDHINVLSSALEVIIQTERNFLKEVVKKK